MGILNKKSLLLIPLLLLGGFFSGCRNQSTFVSQEEAEKQGYRRIDFQFGSKDGLVGEDFFFYTDDFFASPASKYDPVFTHASFAWAMSSFSSQSSDKVHYEEKYRNALATSKALGFSDFEYNDDFTKKPRTDTIGLVCSRKSLSIHETPTTVLLLGIRGAGYEAEWASNFTLGLEGEHAGFGKAADTAISFVNDYIEKYAVSGKIKVWVAGYSRAGATTNLFAGKIDDGLVEGQKLLEGPIDYEKDDIYAYCFEAPKGAENDGRELHGDSYSNIQCFLNPDDAIPLVAPIGLGFDRYGRQNYLPGRTRTLNYAEYEKKMLDLYTPWRQNGHKKIQKYSVNLFQPQTGGDISDNSFFAIDKNKVNWTFELQARALVNYMVKFGIGDRRDYFEKIQPGLVEAIGMLYQSVQGSGSVLTEVMGQMVPELLDLNLSKILIDDLMFEELHEYFGKDLAPFLIRAFRKSYPEIPLADVQKIANGLSGLITAIAEVAHVEPDLIGSLISLTNIAAFTTAHHPEVNYHWIKAMDPLVYREPIPNSFGFNYRRVLIDGAKDADFYDESGLPIAQFRAGRAIELNDTYCYGIVTFMNVDTLTVYLPTGHSYHAVIHAQAEDDVAITINTFVPQFGFERDTYSDWIRCDREQDIPLQIGEN